MVFASSTIELPVVHANTPFGHRPRWDELIFVILNHGHAFFLWHILHQTHPRTIGNGLDSPEIQLFYDFFIHQLLHGRVQPFLMLHARFVLLFQLYFVLTNSGGNPSDIRYSPPNGLSMLPQGFNKCSTRTSIKNEETITSRVSLDPRNFYLKCGGSGLSSSCGGSIIEGLAGEVTPFSKLRESSFVS